MKVIRVIFIIFILVVMYYFFVGYYNGTINRRIEKFTSLNGLNPLTTYDDYGTFNFILQTDDFPYYEIPGKMSIEDFIKADEK